MSPKPTSLPDLDDDEFTARLRPLEAVVVPRPGSARHQALKAYASDRNTGYPDIRISQDPRTEAEQHEPLNASDHRPGGSEVWNRGDADNRISELSGLRASGLATPRSSEVADLRGRGLVDAAERLMRIEQRRGPKRRFEFLIPKRVGDALAEDAARQGKSATIRLLEILRDAGYPVIPEDLIDLRKERRR